MIIIDSIGTELLLNKRNCYYWHEYFISFKKKFIWTEYVKSLIIFFNNQHRQSSLFNTPPQKLPSKVTADALTSNILISPLLYPSHITWSRVLTVHVSRRVSHARGAMFTTHYLRSRLSQWRHPSWCSSCSSSWRCPWQRRTWQTSSGWCSTWWQTSGRHPPW